MATIIPDSIKFAVLDVGVQTVTETTTSDHLVTLSRVFPTHRYTAKLETVPQKRGRDQRFVEALLESLNGRYEIIQIKIPEISHLLGNITGNVTVTNAVNKGATQITLTTDSGSIADAFFSGSPIQFGNHSKVYKVIGDVDSLSNSVTIDLTLPLLKDVPQGTVVTYDNIYYSMRQVKDERSYKLTGTNKHVASILNLEENL